MQTMADRDGVIWFDFRELCDKPRGSIDYIEIACAFNTVMISNMPQLLEDHANAARRFIIMVDEFYDRNVKLLISAEKPIDADYLRQLNEAYTKFFHYYDRSPLLIVNSAEIDLVNNQDHYQQFVQVLLQTKSGRHYYNPSVV